MLDSKALGVTVQVTLDEIAQSAKVSSIYRDDYWTRQIKQRLCELGLESGCEVNAAGCERATGPEWLYDMTWAKFDGQRCLRLPLVLESEWSAAKHEIDKDFGKLVAAKADLKVFVFLQRSEDQVNGIFQSLHQTIDDFEVKLPGERYLLAGYCIHANKFSFRQFIVNAKLELTAE